MQDFSIRQASSLDIEPIQTTYAPIVANTAIPFEKTPPTPQEMAGRITATLDQGYPYLVGDISVIAIAYALAGRHRISLAYRWIVDVTVYVVEEARASGVGYSLYFQLSESLRQANSLPPSLE